VSSKRSFKVAIVCTVLVLFLSVCLFDLSKLASEYLSGQASDPGIPSRERIRDVTYLRRIPGSSATKGLVAVVVDPSAPFDSRNAAATALKAKNDPAVSDQLALLLQPHSSQSLRASVVDALSDLPCDFECTKSVLHYLERMWRGDSNSEDLAMDSSPVETLEPVNPELLNADLTETRQRQQHLISQLDGVLIKNRSETLAVLRQVYGLGTLHPSGFAVYMVTALRIDEACPELSRTHLDDISGAKLAEQIRRARAGVCKSQ